MNLPFDLPSDRSEQKETVLYHLVNLTWYFRRRFVDSLYKQLLSLSEEKDATPAKYKKMYDEIRHELMDVVAQSIIRKVESPKTVREALGKSDPTVRELMTKGKNWYKLQPQIFKLMNQRSNNSRAVANKMYELASMNYDFYRASARAYAEVSEKLELPEQPS